MLLLVCQGLAIQNSSATPGCMGRGGRRHNPWNTVSHAAPSPSRRALSIADNPQAKGESAILLQNIYLGTWYKKQVVCWPNAMQLQCGGFRLTTKMSKQTSSDTSHTISATAQQQQRTAAGTATAATRCQVLDPEYLRLPR